MNEGLRFSLAKQVILSVLISTWKPNRRKLNSLNKANTSLFGRVVVWQGRAGRAIQQTVLGKKMVLD